MQIGTPIATLNESVPGHFTVTGAASIHAALADVGSPDDASYISSTGVWSGTRPYVTLQLSQLLRPHLQATFARIYIRSRMTGTGGYAQGPQLVLMDQVSRPWSRALVSVVIPQQAGGWVETEYVVPSIWLRGGDLGIRECEDLGMRIYAPGSVLSGTPGWDCTVAVTEVEDKYPFTDVAPCWGVRNLGGGLFANVDYLGLVGAIGAEYTTQTQSSTPLTADTAIQAACQRAGYTIPPGDPALIVAEPGCVNMCPTTKLSVQGGGGATTIWFRQNGAVGANTPYRNVHNLMIRSSDPSNTGRMQVSTPAFTMFQGGQFLPWGFVGFENVRLWKFNSDRAIETIFDEASSLSLLGLYNCHHDGSYVNGYNYRMGARLGYHKHDICDSQYAWASEHAGPYSSGMQGASQQLRSKMTFPLAFNPNHPDASAMAATGLMTGKAVNDVTQIVTRANRCDASGAGPPAFGTYLMEGVLADNVTNGTSISIAGHLGGVILRRCEVRNAGSGCVLVWTSSAYNQAGQFHGFHTNLGQFDGLKTSPPFVDCFGTGRKPHGAWPGGGVAYSNGEIIVEDCKFTQKSSASTVPMRFSGALKVIDRRNDYTALTKTPTIASDEWINTGGGNVYSFAWPNMGGCGPLRTLAYQFEGYGTNVAASNYWNSSVKAAGRQMGFGARDNPYKPQGPSVTIPYLTAAQLNALSADVAPPPASAWPPWPQPGEPTSGGFVQNRHFFAGLRPPNYSLPFIEYPTPILEPAVLQRGESYKPPVLMVGGVGNSVQFTAAQLFRSEHYAAAPVLNTAGAQVQFTAAQLFRSEHYAAAPTLGSGEPTTVYQAFYQQRSEHYAGAPYLQATVPSVIEPVDQVVTPITDIALVVDQSGADIRVEGGDVRRDHGLRTAVLLSLFCDARATAEDGVPGQFDLQQPSTALRRDLRGWWSEPAFGSKLWLLKRAKLTPAAVELAEQWVTESLSWLVEREFAERVEVEVAIANRTRIEVGVTIVRGRARAGGSFWSEGLEELVEADVALRVLFT